MNDFDAIVQQATRTQFTHLGKQVIYRDVAGDVETVAIIDRITAALDFSPSAIDVRYLVTLQRADVASPARDASVITAAGQRYVLSEEVSDDPGYSDEWVTTWTASKR